MTLSVCRRVSVRWPERLRAMLGDALQVVRPRHRGSVGLVVATVASAAWTRWIAKRLPADNRPEHEWVVFAAAMRIAEAEGLSLSAKRVAAAFCFTHDAYFIPRITERRVREAVTVRQRARLAAKREAQRRRHMEGGALLTGRLLARLRAPGRASEPLLTAAEIRRCVELVRVHDGWKLSRPNPPSSLDRLALACVEADALWPLHPLGVLADLERPGPDGVTGDAGDPAAWRRQARESLVSIVEARRRWKRPRGEFHDATTIFRTAEGHRLHREWRALWNL